jgi:hypothetical protein
MNDPVPARDLLSPIGDYGEGISNPFKKLDGLSLVVKGVGNPFSILR